MRTLVQQPNATRPAASAKPPGLRLPRAHGQPAAPRTPPTRPAEPDAGLRGAASPLSGHDFSRLAIHARTAGTLQAKLTINQPGDPYEREADRVSAQVMRLEDPPDIGRIEPPAIQRLGTGDREELAARHLQRRCSECEEEALHRKAEPAGAGQVPRQAEAKVAAVSGGQPLTNGQQAFFESRFGVDFSRVRIHADGPADAAARSVGALAYTRGSDIVFRGDQYRPDTLPGRQLLAHELTHVVQQGAAPDANQRSANGSGETHAQGSSGARLGMAGEILQRAPGDGMSPPGDCTRVQYVKLRVAIGTAKTVSMGLGSCKPGDSCTVIAAKIAAWSAMVTARIAEAVECFKGGNTGHQTEINNNLRTIETCYEDLLNSKCDPGLVEKMRVVVEAARAAVAALAVVVVLAVVVALIAALIAAISALVELILAALAAAAESAPVAAAAAAVLGLLNLIKEGLSSDDTPAA